MGDTFIEQMVKRKNDAMIVGKKIAVVLIAVILFSLVFMLILSPLATVGLLLGAGIIYGAWWFISSMNVEFEYIYTNGEMDVDKVMAKRKRKRLTTVRISSFDVFEPFDSDQYDSRKYDKVIDAAAFPDDPGAWYAVYQNREGKQCCLVFSPNEALLKELQLQYKRHNFTHQ